MARTCKLIGSTLSVLGVVIVLFFVLTIARDDTYRTAAFAASRNPGNVMYETELGVARVRRAFQVVGLVAGALLGINGATLFGLGVVAGRVDHR
jgi:hypothetical protein